MHRESTSAKPSTRCAAQSPKAGLHFRVEETVHLAILQFAKFPLWKDLDESWKALSRNSLVDSSHRYAARAYVDPVPEVAEVDLDELGIGAAGAGRFIAARAVAEAVGGRTFVLEGPPGTGKSQTITNLLAHAMSVWATGAVRRREAGGAGRRQEASGSRRFGRAFARPARQVRTTGRGARADQRGPGPSGQPRHRSPADTN